MLQLNTYSRRFITTNTTLTHCETVKQMNVYLLNHIMYVTLELANKFSKYMERVKYVDFR